MSQKPSLDPEDVIHGGCRDGFWVQRNCDMAAKMGLCTYSRIEDRRPAKRTTVDLTTTTP